MGAQKSLPQTLHLPLESRKRQLGEHDFSVEVPFEVQVYLMPFLVSSNELAKLSHANEIVRRLKARSRNCRRYFFICFGPFGFNAFQDCDCGRLRGIVNENYINLYEVMPKVVTGLLPAVPFYKIMSGKC